MPTTFVTGGSGFVGRKLIATLRVRGDVVRALARSDEAVRVVEALGAEPVRGDLDDQAAMAAGMRGCEWAVHSAAKAEDWGRPADFHRINVRGTQRVIEAARAASVRRLVHIGTEAVLAGRRPIVDADETWPIPRDAVGLYPRTKGQAERAALAGNGAGLEVMVVRPRFIWGPDDTSLLPKIAAAVRRGSFAWIDGGRYRTSTCHIDNVCAGIVAALERGRGGEVYFLTDGPPVEMRAFLGALLRSAGVEPPERSIPRWLARAAAWLSDVAWTLLPLPGSPPITRTAVRLVGEEVTVRDAKARRELGYAPRAFDPATGGRA